MRMSMCVITNRFSGTDNMKLDKYGRRVCNTNCVAFFERDEQPYCDALLMRFTKDEIVCNLSSKYKILVEDSELC